MIYSKMKQQLLIIRGLPACGKTTYAEEWVSVDPENRVKIEKDEIRKNSSLFEEGFYNHDRGDETLVIRERDRQLHEAFSRGKSVVSSDTNLAKKHLTAMKRIANKYGVETKIHNMLDVPLEEVIKRDQKRRHPVGEQVIRGMFYRHVKKMPTFLEYNEDLPTAIVCDIDGTLTTGPKDRSPFEWHKVGQDDINLGVSYLLDGAKMINAYKLILVTGRDAVCRSQTEEWLERHNIEYDELYMRQEADNRQDVEVKQEIIERHIKNKYNVLIWLEDRARVTKMLRDVYGINVAQLGDPYYQY